MRLVLIKVVSASEQLYTEKHGVHNIESVKNNSLTCRSCPKELDVKSIKNDNHLFSGITVLEKEEQKR